ncbi:MAG: intein-containing RctB family protein [Anaerolineae bacterium]
MVSKKDMLKLEEWLYEIPANFRADMRVPARIYADEKLLEAAMQDRSLEQLVNTATLPGIVGYALAMPDIHQGYGFVIGGVAATRYPSGVISPGGVGYDINCLAGSSRILHRFGYTLPISKMESSWDSSAIACQDFSRQSVASTPILGYLKQKPHAPVYRVVTEAGDEIIATADHPLWTPEGMCELRRLKEGDQVAIFPFEGVPFETPADEVIVDRADVLRVLECYDKGSQGNAAGQILTHLEKRGLLPLRYNSPQMPFLLKLLGYVWGDGTIYFTNRSGKGTTWFYGKANDLEDIRSDVQELGFTPSRVYTRARKGSIKTFYSETAFKVTSSAFAALLSALGAPVGNKTAQDFYLPAWIFQAPRWQKRLFLAAFFGAELTAPKPFKERNYNFYAPILSISKREPFVASGKDFLRALALLLAEFGVETKTISTRVEGSSHRLRLVLSSKPESLMNLWSKVGFEYNQTRRALANVATQYLKHKSAVVADRARAAEDAVALRAAGVARAEIFARLTATNVNQRFIERSLYEIRNTAPRVAADFATFDEYRWSATAGLGESGMVWERIARMEEIPFDEDVYDFTVAHPDHNFIANGFVVSNCGVRLLRSDLLLEEASPYLDALITALYRNVPSGVGEKGGIKLSPSQMDEVLTRGAAWAVQQGYGTKEDLERLEERGGMSGASPKAVSSKAKERGKSQLGTLGSGNHFLEIEEVVEIYDEEVAERFGLFKGQLVVQIHSGSRGLGHQVCTDYVNLLQKAVNKYGIKIPDRELVCAPLDSPEGRDYFAAMAGAANFAWANRQCIAHLVRRSFEEVLAGKVKSWELHTVYDVAHNIAKIEEYEVDGKRLKVCVHRKGATRAFGPGAKELPEVYREVGQPVLVPGDMGTASYVLVGTEEAMRTTFGSTCHGAGRVLSRQAAKKKIRGTELKEELEAKGIHVRAGSMSGLAEEAPEAYKDIERVVNVVHKAGLARKVARLEPAAVMKG